MILIDAIFFQYNRSGIARVWISLLNEWVRNGFIREILVIDRGGTAPSINGVKYLVIPPHNYGDLQADSRMLQEVCKQESASLFISTYYTCPIETKSVFMAYDMIPEVFDWSIDTSPMWRMKHKGILHAGSFIAISENTAKDLVKFFPIIRRDQITVAHCGVNFARQPIQAIVAFKAKYQIKNPFFLLVGIRGAYKNASLFFEAFSQLKDHRYNYEIVCTGPLRNLEPEFTSLVGPARVHMLELNDLELQCAYSGALALAYPSTYEGFGMPVAEAMACGCPVITCANSSIPEVAGDAVLYVEPKDVHGMYHALRQVQTPQIRSRLIENGKLQSTMFSWQTMAEKVQKALLGPHASIESQNHQVTTPTSYQGIR